MDDLLQKVENIVAKGEIACFVQFFSCHYVFKKLSAAEASESVYMKERESNIDLPIIICPQGIRHSILCLYIEECSKYICGFVIVLGASLNFENNGAIWCILGVLRCFI